MNDYTPIKGILNEVIKSINGYTTEQQNAYKKYGMDIISKFTRDFNENNTFIKLKRVAVSTSSLLLFASCAELFQSICENVIKDEQFFNRYLFQMYDIFSSYVIDERFFDIEKMKMEIAVSGTIESMYNPDITSMFCNSAATVAIKHMGQSSISDNEYEGIKYIQDYLSDNYLNNQWTISYEIMEFE